MADIGFNIKSNTASFVNFFTVNSQQMLESVALVAMLVVAVVVWCGCGGGGDGLLVLTSHFLLRASAF